YGDDPATLETPVVGAQRTHGGGPLLPPMRTVGSAYDEPAYGEPAYGEPAYGEPAYGDDEFEHTGARPVVTDEDAGPGPRRHGADRARRADAPGRRMNLGVVLLPLRVLLGLLSIYAGLRKLCDPVCLDRGKRGSMVTWLNPLHPWEVAEPLRQFTLAPP